MTYFLTADAEFAVAPQDVAPMPEPRSPEEVLSMLALEPPHGEYSVDAF